MDRRQPSASVLVPGVRERTGRAFTGPLRPGIAGPIGGGGGSVAGESRDSDLGMDQLRMRRDSIGQKYPETDPPSPIIREPDRGSRRIRPRRGY